MTLDHLEGLDPLDRKLMNLVTPFGGVAELLADGTYKVLFQSGNRKFQLILSLVSNEFQIDVFHENLKDITPLICKPEDDHVLTSEKLSQMKQVIEDMVNADDRHLMSEDSDARHAVFFTPIPVPKSPAPSYDSTVMSTSPIAAVPELAALECDFLKYFPHATIQADEPRSGNIQLNIQEGERSLLIWIQRIGGGKLTIQSIKYCENTTTYPSTGKFWMADGNKDITDEVIQQLSLQWSKQIGGVTGRHEQLLRVLGFVLGVGAASAVVTIGQSISSVPPQIVRSTFPNRISEPAIIPALVPRANTIIPSVPHTPCQLATITVADDERGKLRFVLERLFRAHNDWSMTIPVTTMAHEMHDVAHTQKRAMAHSDNTALRAAIAARHGHFSPMPGDTISAVWCPHQQLPVLTLSHRSVDGTILYTVNLPGH